MKLVKIIEFGSTIMLFHIISQLVTDSALLRGLRYYHVCTYFSFSWNILFSDSFSISISCISIHTSTFLPIKEEFFVSIQYLGLLSPFFSLFSWYRCQTPLYAQFKLSFMLTPLHQKLALTHRHCAIRSKSYISVCLQVFYDFT